MKARNRKYTDTNPEPTGDAIAATNNLLCNCPPTHHTADCPHFDIWDADETELDLSDELIQEALDGDDPYLQALATLAVTDAPQTELTNTGKPGYQILPDGSIVEHSGHLPNTYHRTSNTYDVDDWSDWIAGSKWDCRHDRQAYVLSDGTEVMGTAWTDTPAHRDWEPDIAAYADSSWVPECVAYHIGWPDFKTPLLKIADVLYIMEHLLKTGREGFKVEVGCIGGHGRTGTMLAILDILSTRGTSRPLGAKAAIARVRANYCQHAIESAIQEWYIKAAHATIFGNPIPRQPKPIVTQYPASQYKPTPGSAWSADNSGRMTWHRTEIEIPTSSLRGDILALPDGTRYLIISDVPGGAKRLILESSEEAGTWLAAFMAERSATTAEHLAKAKQRQEDKAKQTADILQADIATLQQEALERARKLAAENRAGRSVTSMADIPDERPANAPVQVTDGVKRVVRQTPNGPEIEYTTASPTSPGVSATYRDSDGQLRTIFHPIQTKDGDLS